MSYPATLLPAGEGRGGDLLPAPSPEIFSAHTPVERKLTGVVSVPSARVCSLARATSSASGPRLSPRSPAGASGRDSHKPVSCGGAGCASPSAALPGRAIPQSKPVSRFDRPALSLSAITADPRRADPGNPLAGAVSVLRRLPNWPVALRGGGHIASVA